MTNQEVLSSDPDSFRPFYEWLPDQFPIPFIVKILCSLFAGAIFLVPHYMVVEEKILTDWSWLLCLIIVVAMLCLYYATHTFREMFPHMKIRLEATGSNTLENVYLDPIKEYLNDSCFLQFGVLFAVLNCFVGWVLGVSYEAFWPQVTTYVGFFLVGFVCGMPVAGIRGVVITLTRYIDQGQPKVDYTNPDGCGGFLFLGEALIKFSAVTLIVGMLLSIYMLAVWSPNSNTVITIVQTIMWMWIALPFLLSLTILLAPASRANNALMNHKIQKEVELALAFNKARDALQEAGNDDAERRDELRHEIEYYATLRVQLHQMRTWPLNTKTNIKFVILFVSNAWVAFQSIQGMMEATKVFGVK